MSTLSLACGAQRGQGQYHWISEFAARQRAEVSQLFGRVVDGVGLAGRVGRSG